MASGHDKRMMNDGPMIRLVAFIKHEDGTQSVVDIVDTIPHFAYGFMRRFMRDDEVYRVVVSYANNTQSILQGKEWLR